MNIYPSSTDEFQPVVITHTGIPVTTGVMFSVVQKVAGYQPTVPGAWATPMVVGQQIGVRVFGYPPGIYDVWAQVTASPEVPVILAGSFETV